MRQDQAEFKDTVAISAEVGYRIGHWVGRAGLIENSGGAGIDYLTLKDRLRLSAEVWNFSDEDGLNPHAKLIGRYYFTPSIFLTGGWDDLLNTKANRDSFFVGAGIRWGDDDMKYLAGLDPDAVERRTPWPAPSPLFACQSCGATAPKWLGRCPECGDWNSYIEEAREKPRRPRSRPRARRAVGADREIDPLRGSALRDGAPGLRPRARRRPRPGLGRPARGRARDRQVDAPLPGRARRGVGRSAATCCTRAPRSRRRRCACARERLGIRDGRLLVLAETDVSRIVAEAEARLPAVVVVDSVQAVSSPSLASTPGHRFPGARRGRGADALREVARACRSCSSGT